MPIRSVDFYYQTGISSIETQAFSGRGASLEGMSSAAPGLFTSVFAVSGLAGDDSADRAIVLGTYGRSGGGLTSQVVVDQIDTGIQDAPALLSLPDGSLVVGFRSDADGDGRAESYLVRRFDADLDPLTDQVAVRFDDTLDVVRDAALVFDPLAEQVVVVGRDGQDFSVHTARIDPETLGSVSAAAYDALPRSETAVSAIVLETGSLLVAGTAFLPGGRYVTVPTAGVVLDRDGDRGQHPIIEMLPDGGFVVGSEDWDEDNYVRYRLDFFDADGTSRGDGTILAQSRSDAVFQLPRNNARDLDLEVLPSGHVVAVQTVSFELTGADYILANAFDANGRRVETDIVLSNGPGDYYDVNAALLADGSIAVGYRDLDSREFQTFAFTIAERWDGDEADETFDGSGLDDVMFGAGGSDTMFGGFGDDLIDGGAGNDVIYGDGA